MIVVLSVSNIKDIIIDFLRVNIQVITIDLRVVLFRLTLSECLHLLCVLCESILQFHLLEEPSSLSPLISIYNLAIT